MVHSNHELTFNVLTQSRVLTTTQCHIYTISPQTWLEMDIFCAYHYIPIAHEEVHQTAVMKLFGLFEFLVMCFGLCNVTQTFQQLINNILRELDFVFTYIDSVLIASRDEAAHEKHVRTIHECFQKYSIAINFTKCIFMTITLSGSRYR